jgi:flagellar biosynthetic protein FliQ
VDDLELAISVAQRALLLVMEISLPVLLVGLVMGLFMSILQAVTQIQEQMLAFVPKILAMAGILLVILPWVLAHMTSYTREILAGLAVVSG